MRATAALGAGSRRALPRVPEGRAARLGLAGQGGGEKGGRKGKAAGPILLVAWPCARKRAEGRSGELGLLAPWAEMASLFTSPLPISFLFLAPLYLLPSALGWYICVAYHVFTQVGSTRVYYGSQNPMPRVGTDGH